MLSQVKNLREALGLSQFELAVRAKVSVATIQKIEAQQANPSISVLSRIFGCLGLRLQVERLRYDWNRLCYFGGPLLNLSEESSFLKKDQPRTLSQKQRGNLGLKRKEKKVGDLTEVSKVILKRKENDQFRFHFPERTLKSLEQELRFALIDYFLEPEPRKKDVLDAMIIALKMHYPSAFAELKSALQGYLMPKRMTGRLIKLRRIALSSMSEYL